MIADYLILGGGTAGCVLAARLSEDPRRRVILVEAGRDISAHNIPHEVRSRYPGRAYLDTDNIWSSLNVLMGGIGQGNAVRHHRRYEQAKILGGGSAINALMANRGAPSDYEEWETLGANGWGWDACLPYFRKIEADQDFDNPLHGQDGPVKIRRIASTRLSPFVRRVMQILERHGYPIRLDQNGDWEDGSFLGAVAISDKGERQPTSLVYLTDEVRRRQNLRIITSSRANRILFEGARAVGAEITGAENGSLRAAEVIVASGAIHSPALLMRSGIGSAQHLSALGIPLIAERVGVGANLMEHPSIAVSAYLPRTMRERNLNEHHEQAIWRFSSHIEGGCQGDMHAAILARSGWHSVGWRMGSLFFWVNKSYSRGRVKLSQTHPNAEPDVDFRMLTDERDFIRLKEALVRGAQILLDPQMRGYCGTVFPASYSPRVAKIAVPGLWNSLQRGVLSAMLDIAGSSHAMLIHRIVTLGTKIETLLKDDAALSEFVRRHVGGTWHPSGTCRMGRENDLNSVTSPTGKVYGVEGLRVCDASLMPSIPRANTNIPTLMIAERIADFIRAGL